MIRAIQAVDLAGLMGARGRSATHTKPATSSICVAVFHLYQLRLSKQRPTHAFWKYEQLRQTPKSANASRKVVAAVGKSEPRRPPHHPPTLRPPLLKDTLRHPDRGPRNLKHTRSPSRIPSRPRRKVPLADGPRAAAAAVRRRGKMARRPQLDRAPPHAGKKKSVPSAAHTREKGA